MSDREWLAILLTMHSLDQPMYFYYFYPNCRNGHLSIAEYLVDKNCDINATDNYHGKTPLHYAAE